MIENILYEKGDVTGLVNSASQ